MRMGHFFWRGFAAIVACLTALALVAAASLDQGWLWILSWIGLTWHAPLALALLALPADRWSGRVRGVLLVLLLGVAIVWVVAALDFGWDGVEDYIYFAAATTHVLVAAVLLLGLLSLCTITGTLARVLRWVIRLSVVLLTVCWILITLDANLDLSAVPEDVLEKAVSLLTLLMTAGVFCAIALELQSRRQRTAENPFLSSALESCCPRCGHQQSFANGRGACRRCGLHVWIDIHEPRCACGYLLYDLPSDTCPECGRKRQPERLPAAAVPAAAS
jgi:hypothetical protein